MLNDQDCASAYSLRDLLHRAHRLMDRYLGSSNNPGMQPSTDAGFLALRDALLMWYPQAPTTVTNTVYVDRPVVTYVDKVLPSNQVVVTDGQQYSMSVLSVLGVQLGSKMTLSVTGGVLVSAKLL